MAAERTTSDTSERTEGMGKALKRRGLMAGAAALVAGIAAKQTGQPVAAQTSDFSFLAAGGGPAGFLNDNAPGSPSYGYGVQVYGTGAGVYGLGDNNHATDAHGVRGDGVGTGIGVLGNGGGTSGIGVKGVGGAPDGIGVQGNGTGAGPGVYGAASTAGAKGVQGQHTGNGWGVYGTAGGGGVGIYGQAGVAGVVGDSSSVGVMGRGGGDTTSNTTGFPIGVRGSVPSTGYGVYGNAGVGYGLYGNAPGGVGVGGAGGTGVLGTSGANSTSKGVYGHHTGNGYGVYGDAGDGGYGVTGVGTTAFGVVGQSASGTGVYGATSTGKYGVYGLAGGAHGAGGVVGAATQAGTIGFAGVAYAPATDAGYFTGNVTVFGNLGVSGGKFAVVKGADNQYRGMYAVESPECWFEDFGTGTLAAGKAEIKLDPLFAQHVHTDSYHVFLTENGTHHHLSVPSKQASGFAVQADVDGAKLKGKAAADLSGTFSWRVVAKRSDIAGERLPVWEMPTPAFTKPEPPSGKKP